MTDSKRPEDQPSLAARLRRTYGSDVDPGVKLPDDAAQASGAGTIDRLKARVVASTRYRLEGEIGRGGMGAILEVWDEDLRRTLAMKVALGPGGKGSSGARDLDPRLVARFLEEAQVTGQLEHPGIVPVHELGLDDNGQVYFTMRYVRGSDLDAVFELVDEGRESWSVTRALGALLKVCEAMAYAHSKGVIHRDLKPANVMVGRFGEVYVMDWGLVRVQGHQDRHDVRIATGANARTSSNAAGAESLAVGRREDASGSSRQELYTMDGDVIGTPTYMSPEQARGELDRLDARSDVYAVGAMLYRLLAGRAPYEGEVGNLATLRALLHGPPTPLDDLCDAPAELIAISEKAMEREPEDRYAGMLELAEDLRAFLEHRVVQAYETGAVAEARKWVRRNRPLAAALAAAVVALVVGLASTWIQKGESDANALLAAERQVEAEGLARVAEERRIEAADSAEEARRQARIAKEVNAFLNDDLLAAIAPENQGIDVTMRQVLQVAAARLAMQAQLEPIVRAELHTTIGQSYQRLGEFEPARVQFEHARALRTAELGPTALDTLTSTIDLAEVWQELNRVQESADLLEEIVPVLEREVGPDHRATLSARSTLASGYADLGRLADAAALKEAVLAAEERLFGEDDNDAVATRNDLALVYDALGRRDEAEAMLRETLAARRRVLGSKHPETLRALNNLAVILTDHGRSKEGIELHEEACELREELLGAGHPETGLGLANLGSAYVEAGKAAPGEAALRKGVEILRAAVGDEHIDTLTSENALAAALELQSKYDEALELRESTLEAQRRTLGPEHPRTLTSLGNLAVLYRLLRRYPEAEELQRETLAIETRVHGPDHPSTLVTLENLGGTLYSMEDYAGSLEILERVIAGRRRVLGDEHPDVGKTTYNMGMIAKSTGDRDLARECFESALEIAVASVGEEHPNTAEAVQQLGNLASEAKDFDEAIEHYTRATVVRRALGTVGEEVGYMLHQIGYAHYSLERYEQALAPLEECVALRRKVLGDDDGATLISLFLLAKSHLRLGNHAECEPLAIEFEQRQTATDGPYIDAGRKLLADLSEARDQ